MKRKQKKVSGAESGMSEESCDTPGDEAADSGPTTPSLSSADGAAFAEARQEHAANGQEPAKRCVLRPRSVLSGLLQGWQSGVDLGA
jgi:hypothetical protein